MSGSFYLICFGVLGCYAGLRTVRLGWVRGVIAIVLVGCLVDLAIDALMPPRLAPAAPSASQQAAVTRPPAAAPAHRGGIQGFLGDRLADLEADRCVLDHLKQTPLSPLVYVVELHTFLEGYRKLQSAHMKQGNTAGGVNDLFQQTFGDVAVRLTPQEEAAVTAGGQPDLETLCKAFGKWTDQLATRSAPEQKQLWDSFRSSLDQSQ